jgi:hypothetical protein
MKTLATSLLIALAAIGANVNAAPVNNEIGAPVFGLAQDNSQVTRAQVQAQIKAAPAFAIDSNNEIGSPVFGLARDNSQVSRAQVEQQLQASAGFATNSNNEIGSPVFGLAR